MRRQRVLLGLFMLAVVIAVAVWWSVANDAPTPDPEAAGPSTTVTSLGDTSDPAPTAPTDESTSTSSAAPNTTRPPDSTTTSAEGLPEADDPEAGETSDSPVPIGEAITLGRWHIGVTSVELDATQTILDHVDFNEEPEAGHQFLIVRVHGVNVSGAHAEPVLGFAVFNGEFMKTPGDEDCGMVPDNVMDRGPVAPGNEFEGNVCFEVPTDQVNDTLLFTVGELDEDGNERFFALQ